MRYECRKKDLTGGKSKIKTKEGEVRDEIKKIMQPTKQEEKRKYAEEDIEEWLRVSLPILEGPFASKPWIKYVLKELIRVNGLAVGI
ncbi:hypothetical protein M2349_001288 [Caldanaerobacter subterraneus subsp. tengcongensis MB4]|jgi:hypothetical protein|uniref:Uncharacterized protein n=1 Tax=Caldanaerobacter subterraneus subsp. tengcongensis (strain DSM 15242 / JCM 11007 / NBRC 100824 / MB4) TaxID=273068 RepID=Q8RAW7_CALS4|nr:MULTISPECIES: hypothetical protein [Thermoanaerobacteraceae]AAM24318.1 hypothetical protein TTE1071 [Caldanaerobacter subterraneus subsp. tengcongensis MB4]MCS3916147.1 hypothetical protein [Caldanaerobacter subterraneus subsp. tengcongensis MB4]SFE71717.1 hypothetical protein SAMN04324257_02620 [Thermoanaerobacter thermohydrosulfuricus]